ncbi:hypothetical protein GCM10014719_49920 [Planomonospora parontospora subsp. antibiotica]|nr:hypothetical protein GCM10014719_49920 [Planomonospora parontospora subsp. antibiotica]GII18369.1 hypothetical protein Ppa05_50950 [Planomonospora parontospora subsp. antibiotica]
MASQTLSGRCPVRLVDEVGAEAEAVERGGVVTVWWPDHPGRLIPVTGGNTCREVLLGTPGRRNNPLAHPAATDRTYHEHSMSAQVSAFSYRSRTGGGQSPDAVTEQAVTCSGQWPAFTPFPRWAYRGSQFKPLTEPRDVTEGSACLDARP